MGGSINGDLAAGVEGCESLLMDVKRILSEGKERARKAVEIERVRT